MFSLAYTPRISTRIYVPTAVATGVFAEIYERCFLYVGSTSPP